MASVRKGGTARHSPFAHLCEGRFLRVGNETDRIFRHGKREACFPKPVHEKTDRAKPATEIRRRRNRGCARRASAMRHNKEEIMSKELAKTYDPKGLEDRLYQKWLDKKILPRRSKSGQETVYHRYPAAKRNRPAAYGPCAG